MVGRKILYFGGGAQHTNSLEVLSLPPVHIDEAQSNEVCSASSTASIHSSLHLAVQAVQTAVKSILNESSRGLQQKKSKLRSEAVDEMSADDSFDQEGGGDSNDDVDEEDDIMNSDTTAVEEKENPSESPSESKISQSLSETLYSLSQPALPPHTREMPYKRCSSTAVQIGRYWLVFGGFSVQRRELGDFWVQ